MAFDYPDAAFIGVLLSQLFMGVYLTVFGLYVKIIRVKKGPLAPVDYGLILLFILCVTTVGLDAAQQYYTLMRGGAPWTAKVNSATSTLSLTLDFLSQIILIFRCWNVWGRNIWVAIPPSVLALASYASGLAVTIDFASVSSSFQAIAKGWWVPLGVTSMGLSLGVNTVVSALMICRIWSVYREANESLEMTGSRLGWVASVLLESAIALFVAQLVYLVLYKIEHPAFSLVAGPVTVVYGLNCTAIMVRVGMNHSFATVNPATTHRSEMMFNTTPPKPTETRASDPSGTTTQFSTGRSESEKSRYRNLQYNETETTIADRV